MPDTIEHIEVIKGTHPLIPRPEPMQIPLIYIVTTNGKDMHEWYTVAVEDPATMSKLYIHMMKKETVEFTAKKFDGVEKSHKRIMYINQDTAKEMSFTYFEEFKMIMP